MEHVTDGLYLAASTAVFLLALGLLFLCGRSVDDMLSSQEAVVFPGQIIEQTRDVREYE
jgi:hypothetical protein